MTLFSVITMNAQHLIEHSATVKEGDKKMFLYKINKTDNFISVMEITEEVHYLFTNKIVIIDNLNCELEFESRELQILFESEILHINVVLDSRVWFNSYLKITDHEYVSSDFHRIYLYNTHCSLIIDMGEVTLIIKDTTN